MKSNVPYYIALHLIIFTWGFTGIVGKLIQLDPLHIVWYRLLFASVGLLIGLKLLRLPLKISNRKSLIKTLFTGLIVALHWFTFYQSIALSTASLGILCLSTVTLHVTWIEPLLFKTKFSWKEFGMGLLMIVGIYIVTNDFDAKQYLALTYGLISAMLAAIFSVSNAHLSKTEASSALTIHEMFVGFLLLSGVLLYKGEFDETLFEMTTSDLLWLLFLGIICTSVAFLITIEVVKKLGTFTVSLSINLEPIYTILLAIVLLHEHTLLSKEFYIGATIIVLVVLGNTVLNRPKKMQ